VVGCKYQNEKRLIVLTVVVIISENLKPAVDG